jgi:cytosol alanyl aminopeptidase
VPKLITFGAMENPGLITFRMTRALASKEQETPSFKHRFAGTMAHELAHQWFGDLVTLDFWDDTWLNESFASWMGDKIVARYRPEWPVEAWRVNDAAGAMREDGLSSARQIHQPIASKDDIYNAFDSITYVKGQSVLEMFEAWIGPERFQSGVRRYMREHAHANATARDFLAALGAESGDKAGAVVPAFSSFIDRPGVPLVRAELSCDKGKPPTIKLAQERYRPLGTTPDASELWHIPTCVRYGEGKSEGRACTLLTGRTGELPLSEAKSCPDRVILKDGGVGYYRAAYAPGVLESLVAAGGERLSLAERLSLIRDAEALIESGRLPVAEGLSLLPRLARDPDPRIVEGAVLLASTVRASFLSEAQRPRFARFVQKTFGKQAAALGLSPKAGEDEKVAQLRPILVTLVAERGEDRKLIAEARQRAERWIGEPASLDEDAIDPVLHIAARHGDRALFDRLYAAAKQEKDQKRRVHLLRAMASFHDPAVVRESLAVLLRGEFDPRDAMMLLRQDEEVADVFFSFTQQNYDALLEKLPRPALGFLPSAFDSMCDGKQRAEVESFFKGRIDKVPGGTRTLAQTLEKIGICGAERAAQRESLEAFLKKNG